MVYIVNEISRYFLFAFLFELLCYASEKISKVCLILDHNGRRILLVQQLIALLKNREQSRFFIILRGKKVYQ
jgi:hypothetical protein